MKAASLYVEIAYLLETEQIDNALQAVNQIIGLATDTEQQQAALYQKAKILLHCSKNESKALAVLDELIQLAPESETALLAQNRIDNMQEGANPLPPAEPEYQQSSDQAGSRFSAVNYPNPANPGTSIKYTLPDDGQVVITIVNVMGHQVIELQNSSTTAGTHTVHWDGRDKSGTLAASGLYFYCIEFKGKALTNKFLLIK